MHFAKIHPKAFIINYDSRNTEGTKSLDKITKNIAILSRNGKNIVSNLQIWGEWWSLKINRIKKNSRKFFLIIVFRFTNLLIEHFNEFYYNNFYYNIVFMILHWQQLILLWWCSYYNIYNIHSWQIIMNFSLIQ